MYNLYCRWDPHYEDKQKFIRKLKIDVTDIKEDDVAIPEDAKESPINQFKLKFMNTGDYLRPHDMRYCIEKVRSLCIFSLNSPPTDPADSPCGTTCSP